MNDPIETLLLRCIRSTALIDDHRKKGNLREALDEAATLERLARGVQTALTDKGRL